MSSPDQDRTVSVYFIALPEPVAIRERAILHFRYDERETPYVASMGDAVEASNASRAVVRQPLPDGPNRKPNADVISRPRAPASGR